MAAEACPDIQINHTILEVVLFLLFVLAIFAFLLFFIVPLIFLMSDYNILDVVRNELLTINIFLAASLSFSAMLFGLARETRIAVSQREKTTGGAKKRWHGLYVIVAVALLTRIFRHG